MPTPVMLPGPRTRLRNFLRDYLTTDELTIVIRELGEPLEKAMPSRSQGHELFVDEFVALMARRGYLDYRPFWDALIVILPLRQAEIEGLAAALIASQHVAISGPIPAASPSSEHSQAAPLPVPAPAPPEPHESTLTSGVRNVRRPFLYPTLGEWAFKQQPRALLFLLLLPCLVGVSVWFFMQKEDFLQWNNEGANSTAPYAVWAAQAVFAGLIAWTFLWWTEPGSYSLFGESATHERLRRRISEAPHGDELRAAVGADVLGNKPLAGWYEDAREATRQLRITWIALWASWMMLYALMFLLSLAPAKAIAWRYQINSLLIALFNNGTTAAILAGFWVLAFAALRTTRERSSEASAVTVGIAASVPILFFLLAHIIVLITQEQGKPFGTPLPEVVADNIALRLLSGVVAAIAMALYVGRLDSAFIGVRFRIIALLYLYAAIQPSWPAVQMFPESGTNAGKVKATSETIEFLLFLYATFAKVLLFTVCAWIYHTGRLEFYFLRIRMLYLSIPIHWQHLTGERQDPRSEP